MPTPIQMVHCCGIELGLSTGSCRVSFAATEEALICCPTSWRHFDGSRLRPARTIVVSFYKMTQMTKDHHETG